MYSFFSFVSFLFFLIPQKTFPRIRIGVQAIRRGYIGGRHIALSAFVLLGQAPNPIYRCVRVAHTAVRNYEEYFFFLIIHSK